MEEKIFGKIEKVNFQKGNWGVVQVKDSKGRIFSAKGHTASQLKKNRSVTLRGFWENHKVYGSQFRILEMEVTENETGLKKLLTSFKGLGPKTAEKILNHFASDLARLEKNPEDIFLVPKISKKIALSFLEAWKSQKIESSIFLYKHGLDKGLVQKILKKYGENSVSVLKNEPYRLIKEVQGIGFLTADRLALSMGIDPESPFRYGAALEHILEEGEQKGHVYLTETQILKRSMKLLGLEEEKIKTLLKKYEKSFWRSPAPNEEIYWGRPFLVHLEKQLASMIKERMSHWKSPPLKYFKTEFNLSSEQENVVKEALKYGFFLLTGGPGVGKTTTARALIQEFLSQGLSLTLTAPTGRAVQRLSQITNLPGKTLHRLLEWTPKGFLRNQSNPLEEDVIIVDEMSMCDLYLAHGLLSALKPKTRLILIGDSDQLPAVGPGQIFKDLLACNGLPHGRLHKIFRQSALSRIITFAHDLNEGRMPMFTGEGDCRFFPTDDIPQTLKNLIQGPLTEAGYTKNHIQILTPMRRGASGSSALNVLLQNLFHPSSRPCMTLWGGEQMGVGDRVIQNSNNYDLGVFNGDIGTVISFVQDSCLIDIQGKVFTYSPKDLNGLKLAYAITVHKSQGSEFPVVIIPICPSHSLWLQKSLLYTALTRAKRLAIFVGSLETFQKSLKNSSPFSRQTLLTQRVLEKPLR